MSYLSIKSLQKSYGGHKILNGINLEVSKGEFICLLGPSGCGKTTTLRCIAGLELPDKDSGPIALDGTILSKPGVFIKPEQRNFGMVFQSYAVWPHLNVFENIAYPLRVKKSDHISSQVQKVMEVVRLKGFEKRFGHELSGGQQQRVALARALVMNPKLLLLDEPLSNLDVLLREELRTEISRIHRELGLTTVLVTHDQREALSLSDRIVILNKGEIVGMGSPESLYQNPPNEFAAEFLSGGQTLSTSTGNSEVFIPRKWKLSNESTSLQGKIVGRLFLGNEYEYLIQTSKYKEAIKFYNTSKLEMGTTLNLKDN